MSWWIYLEDAEEHASLPMSVGADAESVDAGAAGGPAAGEPMTPEQIDALPAGRELDALVHEYIFDTCRCPHDSSWLTDSTKGSSVFIDDDGKTWRCVTHKKRIFQASEVKPYSTDIAAAWEVVEKVRGERWEMRWVGKKTIDVQGLAEDEYGLAFRGNLTASWAGTAPLAICRAALKAILSTALPIAGGKP
jgi:hypothetical protein